MLPPRETKPIIRRPARGRRRCREQSASVQLGSSRLSLFRCCCAISTVILAGNDFASGYSQPLWRSDTKFGLSQASLFPTTHSKAGRSKLGFGSGKQWKPTKRSAAVLRMVLTTPEAIIEQASTQKLLDILLDESTRTTARRPIMMQFDPSSGWIWRRWKGTVFSETWTTCLRNVLYSLIVLYIYRTFPRLKGTLTGFNSLWGQLLSITTFTLTFFVNQSYALWRKCYELSRRLQGRLHDIDMTLAAHAARKNPASPSEPSTYTSASRQLLDLVSRYVRLFNLLTYASFTRSHRPILTPRGMRRLVERGLMTAGEREILMTAEIPATQRHNCVLMWITRVFIEGRQAGHFTGGSGFEQQFMEKIHVIRSQYGAIGDELQGRMPLAYAHLVQVLVDCVLLTYPLMAFTSGMSPLLGVLGTGLLTTSYQGLFDLAKQFLDPYDNENYGRGEDPLSVDTLIAETNAGSLRWMYGFEQMPVSSQRIKDGELFDYLLPVRGYTVEDLDKMEQEKIQKEIEMKELKEQREQEEAEWVKRAEERLEEALSEGEERAEAEETQLVSEEDDAAEGVPQESDEEDMANNEMQTESVPFENQTVSPNSASNSTTLAENVSVVSSANSQTETSADSVPAETSSSSSTHTVTFLEGGIPLSLTNTETMADFSPIDYGQPYLKAEPTEINDGSKTESSELGEEEEERSDEVETTDESSEVAESEQKEEATRASPAPLSESTPEKMPEKVISAPVMPATKIMSSLGRTGDPRENADRLELQKLESNPGLFVPDMEDFESYRELPWFDEVGPDGQEVRLSQLLAEEEWEEEQVYAAEQASIDSPLTLEEYQKRKVEIKEAAESELLETEQILMASPGADIALKEKSSGVPFYDQTKLDGISQLWGLPPDDFDDISGSGPPRDIPKDETSFDGISQLWGQASEGPIASEETTLVGAESFDSIDQLWDGTLSDDGFESEEPASQPELGDTGESSGDQSYNDNGDDDDELDLSAFEGFEWHEDGQGDRLSQMLADEVWDYVEPPEQEDPITLEDYTKKVVEILEAAEDEILETEAILNAPPGADSYTVIEKEEDAEERVLQALNETTGADLSELKEIPEEEGYLDALEMDIDPDEFLAADADASNVTDAASPESDLLTSDESQEPPSLESMIQAINISGEAVNISGDSQPEDDVSSDIHAADKPEQTDEPDDEA